MAGPFGLRDSDWDEKTAAISQATGFYLYWFGLVELAITMLLARILGFDKEYERFDLLVSGLDPRGKVERLKTAGKRYNKPIGKYLHEALEIFSKDERKLRNLMAHSWPILDDNGTIHFGSLGAMPETVFGPAPTRPLAISPSQYRLVDIYDRALWLKKLFIELMSNGRVLSSLEALEVDPVTLGLPRVPHGKADQAPRTKIDKPAQKAARKKMWKRPSE